VALTAPARMIAVLRRQRVDDDGGQNALLSKIRANSSLERRHRIEMGPPCRIEPTLQSRQAESDRQSGGRVSPSLAGQFQQGRLQFPRLRWCRQ